MLHRVEREYLRIEFMRLLLGTRLVSGLKQLLLEFDFDDRIKKWNSLLGWARHAIIIIGQRWIEKNCLASPIRGRSPQNINIVLFLGWSKKVDKASTYLMLWIFVRVRCFWRNFILLFDRQQIAWKKLTFGKLKAFLVHIWCNLWTGISLLHLQHRIMGFACWRLTWTPAAFLAPLL